ncbi:hypothetical protein A2U01_0018422, partial [Trifolium medium]|nr:hypothetical protein [Trifolium medium]
MDKISFMEFTLFPWPDFGQFSYAIPLVPPSSSKTKSAATVSNSVTTPGDTMAKRTRRSSRGSAKPSTAHPLEIEVIKQETRTKASHDRVKASSGDISPSIALLIRMRWFYLLKLLLPNLPNHRLPMTKLPVEDVNSRMDIVPEQTETQVSNKSLHDQQSASLAPSNKSEPAGSSNSSPSSDADKTTS